ncbi:MAG: hypothetical protein ACOYEP_09705 [Limnochordia bacterium]
MSNTVRSIDALVSEYYRLELEERRGSARRMFWQRHLPFETNTERMVQPQEPAQEQAVEETEATQILVAWREVAASVLFEEAWLEVSYKPSRCIKRG